MPKSKQVKKALLVLLSLSFIMLTIEMATGSIIMAVAVLLIHMLIRQVLSIIPQIMPLGLSPVNAKSLKAILLCKCHFSTL